MLARVAALVWLCEVIGIFWLNKGYGTVDLYRHSLCILSVTDNWYTVGINDLKIVTVPNKAHSKL